ncbi:hypothetical protein WN59_06670 [Salinicoccus sediminis]|uniref:Uncharacterized protein n=1 Tax=Salinicoccus sediminis TaxID=1432562 RepID=A0A0M2SJ37_9STAP|nr:hypothetical protein [Salinicoccus sediminis]KKK34709.1 hypothetical protein WN59_06670 [Salinicoccus sediminis]
MTESVKNVFQNRVLDLIRNFSILKEYEGIASFKLDEDPFDMIYVVRDGKLHATVDTHQTQGDMRVYEVTETKHLETLLYFLDEDVPDSERHERFFNNLLDDYTLYLLEEHAAGDEEFKADLFGEISMIHTNAISIQEPHQAAVESLRSLDIFMNSNKVSNEDFETLISELNAQFTEYNNFTRGITND